MTKVSCLAFCLSLATTAFAADKKAAPVDKKAAAAADQQKAMMAEMEKAAAPGPEHKWLTDGVGTWTATSKMFMDPSKPPMESVGTEEVKAVLGGRFVEGHLTSQMFGKPFEGMGLSGYDNAKKKFVMTWVDTMGTMLVYAEGTGDAKQRVYVGEEPGPNGTKHSFRWVIKVESKDKHTMEIYGAGADGKEAKHVEITYTRKP